MSKYGVFSGPHFSVFSLNTEIDGSEKTPYLDTFHAVITAADIQLTSKVNRKLEWKAMLQFWITVLFENFLSFLDNREKMNSNKNEK